MVVMPQYVQLIQCSVSLCCHAMLCAPSFVPVRPQTVHTTELQGNMCAAWLGFGWPHRWQIVQCSVSSPSQTSGSYKC